MDSAVTPRRTTRGSTVHRLRTNAPNGQKCPSLTCSHSNACSCTEEGYPVNRQLMKPNISSIEKGRGQSSMSNILLESRATKVNDPWAHSRTYQGVSNIYLGSQTLEISLCSELLLACLILQEQLMPLGQIYIIHTVVNCVSVHIHIRLNESHRICKNESSFPASKNIFLLHLSHFIQTIIMCENDQIIWHVYYSTKTKYFLNNSKSCQHYLQQLFHLGLQVSLQDFVKK